MATNAPPAPNADLSAGPKPAEGIPERVPDGAAPAESASGYAWEHRIGMFTNPFLWYDLVKVVVITMVLVSILFAVIGGMAGADLAALATVLPLVFAIFGVVVLIGYLITAALYGGGYTMEFEIDAQGIHWTTSRRSGRVVRKVLAAARIWGDLTLNPRLSGSARLAEASDEGRVRWKDVRRAKYYANRRVIAVMDSWHARVRLYCGPREWDQVVARLRWGETEGARLRAFADRRKAARG
jgi:hypothetical protein